MPLNNIGMSGVLMYFDTNFYYYIVSETLGGGLPFEMFFIVVSIVTVLLYSQRLNRQGSTVA